MKIFPEGLCSLAGPWRGGGQGAGKRGSQKTLEREPLSITQDQQLLDGLQYEWRHVYTVRKLYLDVSKMAMWKDAASHLDS